MAIKNKRPTGGRIFQAKPNEIIAVVNKSNVDKQFNDCEPPFALYKLAAGNIAASTERSNCVQFYTKASADKAVRECGADAIECMSESDGIRLLEKAREMGSFRLAYEKLRKDGRIVDLSKSPSEAMSRKLVIKALLDTGMTEADIPPGLGVTELRGLHRDRIAHRTHVSLVQLEDEDEADVAAPVQPQGGRRSPRKANVDMLRVRVESLGGVVNPGHGEAELQAQIDEIESQVQQSA